MNDIETAAALVYLANRANQDAAKKELTELRRRLRMLAKEDTDYKAFYLQGSALLVHADKLQDSAGGLLFHFGLAAIAEARAARFKGSHMRSTAAIERARIVREVKKAQKRIATLEGILKARPPAGRRKPAADLSHLLED